MSLIEELQAAEVENRETNLAEYREILGRNDTPKSGDGKRLKALLTALGFDTGRLTKDLEALRQAAALATQAAVADDLHENFATAQKALLAFRTETEKIEAERHDEDSRLSADVDLFSRQVYAAKDAAGKLAALKARNHELFGVAPPRPRDEGGEFRMTLNAPH
jgi:hypothetical protein